jgi:hypothetical protein
VTAVDWSRWRKCPGCGAEIGEACVRMTGRRGEGTYAEVVADKPHGNRRPRTRGAS